MTTVFLIHSAYGGPDENWLPWLKAELEHRGCRVIAPKFPTPEGQSLTNWLKILAPYKEEISRDTIFVGHSIAPAFILAILENLKAPVKASFFVAGFTSLLGNPDFDTINSTFVSRPFDWQKIRRNCQRFFIYCSDNDPYVPARLGEALAENLGTSAVMIKGAGHFNAKAGYTKFPKLLEDLTALL